MQISRILRTYPPQLIHSSSPRLDVEIILSHAIQKDRAFLYAWDDYELKETEMKIFEKLFQERLQGKPIAYLIGKREFWSMELLVNEHTLIPRPETELLVEVALEHLSKNATLFDLGTGSGCIAIAIKKERPNCRIVGTDNSLNSLNIAKKNGQNLKLEIEWRESDWFFNLKEKADIIVSNPPYIAPYDPHLMQGDVRFEPRSALISENNGLQDIKYLIDNAKLYLKNRGWLFLEHGFDQGKFIKSLLKHAAYTNIKTYQDSNGQDRVSGGQIAFI
jgi:release factor glutamine methyltransferase